MKWGNVTMSAIAVFTLAGGAWAQEAPDGAADGRGVKVQVLGGPKVKVAVARPSGYWIGVALAGPVQESEEAPGLEVVKVIPDSPAAKAGIKPGDRLLKAGKKKVAEIGDLKKAIDDAKGKPLAIEVARKDETLKLEITPAKRAAAPFAWRAPMPPVEDAEALKEWVEKMQKGQLGAGPLRFRVFGPGAIVPGVGSGPQPDDMTITITKKGENPARVVVKQGEETWKTTVDKLGELPDEVRPHVARLLGRGVWGRVQVHEGPKVEVKPAPRARVLTPHDQLRRHLDEQMKQLQKQLDEMNERIEELHRTDDAPAEKPKKI